MRFLGLSVKPKGKPNGSENMDRDRSLVERYRDRAEEIRRVIEGLPGSDARNLLVQIAADYDGLSEAGRILDQSNRPHTDS